MPTYYILNSYTYKVLYLDFLFWSIGMLCIHALIAHLMTEVYDKQVTPLCSFFLTICWLLLFFYINQNPILFLKVSYLQPFPSLHHQWLLPRDNCSAFKRDPLSFAITELLSFPHLSSLLAPWRPLQHLCPAVLALRSVHRSSTESGTLAFWRQKLADVFLRLATVGILWYFPSSLLRPLWLPRLLVLVKSVWSHVGEPHLARSYKWLLEAEGSLQPRAGQKLKFCCRELNAASNHESKERILPPWSLRRRIQPWPTLDCSLWDSKQKMELSCAQNPDRAIIHLCCLKTLGSQGYASIVN